MVLLLFERLIGIVETYHIYIKMTKIRNLKVHPSLPFKGLQGNIKNCADQAPIFLQLLDF